MFVYHIPVSGVVALNERGTKQVVSDGSETQDESVPDMSVVVPVYKEEESIRPFLTRIEPVLERLGTYEIIFCVDPSPDRTEEIIHAESQRNPRIGMLVFSRRFGQPAATMAGILNCSGKTCVVIDVDLQDPPELIAEIYGKLREGFEVVYAKRRSRKGEALPKRLVSYLGYKVIKAVAHVEIPRDTGDFRVMTRRVIEELRQLREGHGFLRGLVAYVGFNQGVVEYDRDERAHGQRKYNRYLGSLKIGLTGLVGFSNFLLTATLFSGLIIAGVGFALAVLIVIAVLVFNVRYGVLGIPTIITLILFLGGVQLISIGVLGEYIGRIYDEVKRRPQYIVDRAVNVRSVSGDQGVR